MKTIGFLKKALSFFHWDGLVSDTVASLLESETDALVLTEKDGSPLYMNRAAKDFFGTRDLRAVVSDRVMADEDSNKLALAKLDAALKNHAETKVDLLMVPQTGEDGLWEWWRIGIKQLDVGTLWRVQDITPIRTMEAVFLQEKQENADFLDSLPVGLYQTDADGTLRFVNQRLSGWLGFSDPRDLKGRRIGDILTGSAFPDLDGVWSGELTFKAQSGSVFSAFVSHVIYDDNGETKLRAAVVRDIGKPIGGASDRAGRGNYTRLFDEAPVGIAFLDRDNVISEANAKLFQLLERSRDDVIGANMRNFVDDADVNELENKQAKIVMNKNGASRITVKLKTEKERHADLYLTPVSEEDESGDPEVFGFIVYFADGTERFALNQQVTMAERMRAAGQLAGGVAHDLNNQLTAVLGSTELLLQSHPANDPDFVELQNIYNCASRAGALASGLLSFSRKQPFVPTFVDVTEQLAELQHTVRRILGPKVAVQVENGRNLGYIRVDKTQFETVFVNMAVNARDAMPDGGVFKISTRLERIPPGRFIGSEAVEPGEYVAIDIADTGCGIPENVISHIFEPFFTTKRPGVDSGTGLGLSTAHGTIRQAGGYLSVKSEVGVGTTFTIYMERHSPEAVRKAEREKARVEKPTVPPNYDANAVAQVFRVKPPERKTDDQLSFSFVQEKPSVPLPLPVRDLSGSGVILLVEDEDGVRAVTKRALTARGYTVEDCVSAEEALEKAASGFRFDLLITDMLLPAMNGADLSVRLRQDGIYTKILLVSGFSEEAARGDIGDMPDFYFLPKPFSLRDLSEKVKQILEEK